MADDLLDCLLSAAIEHLPEALEPKTNPKTSFDDTLGNLNIIPGTKPKKKKLTDPCNSKATPRLSIIHHGETDSSDDEDNRDFENRKYNESGRDIKHLMEGTTSTVNSYSNIKESTWKTKLEVKKQNSTPLLAKKTVPDSTSLFGVRVINPLISTTTFADRMVGREVVPMANLKLFVRNIAPDKDWVIVGVIVQKSATRTSQKGKNYCIWTLSDLKNELKTVVIFLFGNAYKELWKTVAGTVIGILNPSVMDLRDGSKDEACLSVDNHQRVMIIGQSKDLGTCKSNKKNGDRCTAFVNTNICEYCIYHVKQEYQKATQRSDLQSGFTGRGLTALRNKVLGKDQIFYAGKLYTAIPAKKSKKQTVKDEGRLLSLAAYGKATLGAPVKSQKQKQAARLEIAADQRKRDLERLRQLGLHTNLNLNSQTEKFTGTLSRDVTVADSKSLALDVIAKLKKNRGEENKNKEGEEKKIPSLTEEDLQEQKKSEVVPKLNSDDIDLNVDFRNFQKNFLKSPITKPSIEEKPIENPSEFGRQQLPKKDLNLNISQDLTKSPSPTLKNPSLNNIPFLSNNGKSKIDLSVPVWQKDRNRAKQKALSWIQNNGPIKKQNPNNTRGTEKGKKRALESINENENPKKAKIEENEFFSDRFKKMMAATSNHADLLEARDDEEQEKYFNKLEVKERMEEKMLTTYKVACKAVKCLKCKYTSFSASDLCKTEKHPLRVFDAMKRFFKCGNCGNRTVCLSLVPIIPCKNCGSSKWEKTSMMKERKVEIAAPKLSIRGGEQKFTNSVVGDANLNLMVPDEL